MISYQKIQKLGKMRLGDARVLYDKKRYNGALYICGYANEFALKALICKRLKLKGIPNTSKEFKNIQDIKTHNLENLKKLLENIDKKVVDEFITKNKSHWDYVLNWHPETRYSDPDEKLPKQQKKDTEDLIKSTTVILNYFWKNL